MGLTEYYLVSDDVLAEFRDRADEPEFWAAHWKSMNYPQLFTTATGFEAGERYWPG